MAAFFWHLWRMLQGCSDWLGCPSQDKTSTRTPLNINLKESEGEKCAAVVTTASYRSTPHPLPKSPPAAYGYHSEGFSGLTWVNIETHHKHHYFLLACRSSSSVQVQVFRCVQRTWRKRGGWPGLIKSDWLPRLLVIGTVLISGSVAVGKREELSDISECRGFCSSNGIDFASPERFLRPRWSVSRWLEYEIPPLKRHGECT